MIQLIRPKNLKHSGQAMLVAILIITAVALSIGLTVAATSSSELKSLLATKKASQAYYLAEGCLENHLMSLVRQDFRSPLSFTFPTGSCTIEISGTAPDFEVTSSAKVGASYRTIKVTVHVVDEVVTINQWKEVY